MAGFSEVFAARAVSETRFLRESPAFDTLSAPACATQFCTKTAKKRKRKIDFTMINYCAKVSLARNRNSWYLNYNDLSSGVPTGVMLPADERNADFVKLRSTAMD